MRTRERNPVGASSRTTVLRLAVVLALFAALAGALPALAQTGCTTDVVFVLDTSGSMSDEWGSLCSDLAGVISDLASQGIIVEPFIVAAGPGPNSPATVPTPPLTARANRWSGMMQVMAIRESATLTMAPGRTGGKA